LTSREAERPDDGAGRVRLVPAGIPPRSVPRLDHGVVWSEVVAEIERDLQERMRGAA
jgi:hypothetical protein